MTRRLSLLLVLLLTLTGWSCTSGSPTLKARSAAADSIVLSGETFLLVGSAFNAMCPARKLSLETCQGFRKFAEEFKVKYPALVAEYQGNKDVATASAQMAEDFIRQLTGFSKVANAAAGVK